MSLNNGAGAFTQRSYPFGFYLYDHPIGDLNGDGKTDLIRINNAGLLGGQSTPGIFNETQFTVKTNVCDNFGQPKIVDFTRDGRTELTVWRPSDGRWRYVNSSIFPRPAATVFFWSALNDLPVPGDYDGDGKADICVRRRSSNSWYILRSYNNQVGAIQFGITEDIAQTGDWDGNGIMDIGVYRPSTRFWYATGGGGLYLGMFGEAGEIPAASIQR